MRNLNFRRALAFTLAFAAASFALVLLPAEVLGADQQQSPGCSCRSCGCSDCDCKKRASGLNPPAADDQQNVCRTDEQGMFKFADLVPGEKADVWVPGTEQIRDVPVGREDLAITAEKSGR